MIQSDQSPAVAVAWIGRRRKGLLIGGVLLVALVTLATYALSGRYVSTDDAYVQSARVNISTSISERLKAVYVHDNQAVKAGTVLLALDSGRLEVAVQEAEAQLAAAKLKIQTLQATYQEKLAGQAAAQDSLSFQQKEYDRQVKLAEAGISSHAQLEKSENELASTRQRLAAARQQSASAFAELNGDPNAPPDSQPGVRQAQAALDRARLDLSYTVVRAPVDGVVTKVEQIQAGDYIQTGAPLFALVADKNVWIEANYKETDLTYVHPGQKATFTLDTYPGRTFAAVVQSVSPGTGSSFSLLPPENSSGNWVKVVQRLPIRLAISDPPGDVFLHAGMSAVVRVDTGQRHNRLAGLVP